MNIFEVSYLYEEAAQLARNCKVRLCLILLVTNVWLIILAAFEVPGKNGFGHGHGENYKSDQWTFHVRSILPGMSISAYGVTIVISLYQNSHQDCHVIQQGHTSVHLLFPAMESNVFFKKCRTHSLAGIQEDVKKSPLYMEDITTHTQKHLLPPAHDPKCINNLKVVSEQAK